jgi:hypothetical protein
VVVVLAGMQGEFIAAHDLATLVVRLTRQLRALCLQKEAAVEATGSCWLVDPTSTGTAQPCTAMGRGRTCVCLYETTTLHSRRALTHELGWADDCSCRLLAFRAASAICLHSGAYRLETVTSY